MTAVAAEGAAALRAGLLVGFATETVYGIGAVATSAEALARLRGLKSRPKRPFSVHIAQPQDAYSYVRDMPPEAARLIARAWPGPVTVLIPVGGAIADAKFQKAGLYETLCANDVMGLRCPDAPVTALMLAGVDAPVVAPSANPPGQPPARNAEQVLASLDGRIDLLIDTGPARYGQDSTIVRFAPDGWKIVRRGVYGPRTIRRLLGRWVLFVCTGNTCRSPMAVGLARKMLAERMDCPTGGLAAKGMEFLSAGVLGVDGGAASPEAVRAARRLGANISDHRSRKLAAGLINQADVIFCMTDHQISEVRRLVPSAAGKVYRLDGAADVPDPIGSGPAGYRRTSKRIEKALRDLVEKGML